jgi:hypothetical protein
MDKFSDDEILLTSIIMTSLTEMQVRRVLTDRGLNPTTVEMLVPLLEPICKKLDGA